MQDIMSDLEQNPDITYQEAAAHYIDTAELTVRSKNNRKGALKIVSRWSKLIGNYV